LAIMAMTTFKLSTAALHLLAIACIMLVVVQVTEAARELDDGVGGVLVNGEQVASVHTKAGLTVFQAAACELLWLPCAVQSSNDDCSACNWYSVLGAVGMLQSSVPSRFIYWLVRLMRSQNLRISLRSVNLKIVVSGVHVWMLLFLKRIKLIVFLVRWNDVTPER